jgi:hypothetical protein
LTDYTAVISQILSAKTTDDIMQAVSSYSAAAVGPGGILYSGDVGNASARTIALDVVAKNAANGVTVNIIDDTARGMLLLDTGVKQAILGAAQTIYMA